MIGPSALVVMPVRKISTRSLRGVGGAGTLVDRLDELRHLGVGDPLDDGRDAWRPCPGVSELNASLSPAGTTTSLTSGWPSRETCTQPPDDCAVGHAGPRGRSVVVQTPITGLRLASPFSATSLNGTCSAMRVDVVAGQGVLADLAEVAAVEQVEDPQVEEERVVGLAGEALPAAREVDDGLVAQLLVVRHRRRADPRRRDRRVGDPGDERRAVERRLQRVGLPEQQVLVVERRDRPVVVEERVVAPLVDVLERPPEDGVRLGVAVVVDVDVVRGRRWRTGRSSARRWAPRTAASWR